MNRAYFRNAADHGIPEEGLNEAGEAPPPYRPDGERHGQGTPTVPQPALTRDDAGSKPPDYEVHDLAGR